MTAFTKFDKSLLALCRLANERHCFHGNDLERGVRGVAAIQDTRDHIGQPAVDFFRVLSGKMTEEFD